MKPYVIMPKADSNSALEFNTAQNESEPRSRQICLGSGLVTLDMIYDNESKDPMFFAGGTCCNVLTILAYLGWDSFPLARLGMDPEGDRIVDDMERWGVRTEFVERDLKIHTPRIIERIYGGNKPYHRFHLKCEHGFWLPQRKVLLLKRLQSILGILPRPDVFYFDRADPAALRAAATFKEQGSIIMFEPPRMRSSRVFTQCLELADIVKYGYMPAGQTEHLAADVPLEIQTRGAKGLRYRSGFLDNKDWAEMEAISTPRLADAAGSGDWLTAGLLYTLQRTGPGLPSSEKKLLYALRFGQALASINCGFVGARGAMYSLTKPHLLSIANNAASGSGIPHIISSKSGIETSSLSTGCKTCFCTCPD